jgi:hypothetical protein
MDILSIRQMATVSMIDQPLITATPALFRSLMVIVNSISGWTDF